jgi:hypothetical protein
MRHVTGSGQDMCQPHPSDSGLPRLNTIKTASSSSLGARLAGCKSRTHGKLVRTLQSVVCIILRDEHLQCTPSTMTPSNSKSHAYSRHGDVSQVVSYQPSCQSGRRALGTSAQMSVDVKGGLAVIIIGRTSYHRSLGLSTCLDAADRLVICFRISWISEFAAAGPTVTAWGVR